MRGFPVVGDVIGAFGVDLMAFNDAAKRQDVVVTVLRSARA